jgi:hypothetical protein
MNIPDRTFIPKNLFDVVGSKWVAKAQLTGSVTAHVTTKPEWCEAVAKRFQPIETPSASALHLSSYRRTKK